MFVHRFDDCKEIVAGDDTVLRELLSGGKDGLAIPYGIAHARLALGKVSTPHRLKETTEIYYIVNGNGVMHIDSESEAVGKKDSIVIPAGSVQFLENTGDEEIEFLCITSPPWRAEDEEVLG
jgi:mannose-6-phosphate isomerase-like protein (cupin superfamily)